MVGLVDRLRLFDRAHPAGAQKAFGCRRCRAVRGWQPASSLCPHRRRPARGGMGAVERFSRSVLLAPPRADHPTATGDAHTGDAQSLPWEQVRRVLHATRLGACHPRAFVLSPSASNVSSRRPRKRSSTSSPGPSRPPPLRRVGHRAGRPLARAPARLASRRRLRHGHEATGASPTRPRNAAAEFEEGRRIAWRTLAPTPLTLLFTGRTWRYELEPVEGGARIQGDLGP